MSKRRPKQMRAREFSPKERDKIYQRDQGKCIFCEMDYETEGGTWFSKTNYQIMHYIPKSHNGLGVAENGAIGCLYHHEMLDNGNRGRREEMLRLFKEYLQRCYPEWKESALVYNKWSF